MSLFDDIPDDPEMAFLHLEKIFRDEYTQALEGSDHNYDPTEDQLRYISRTLAARTELDLTVLKEWILPSAHDFTVQIFQNFRLDVDHYRTILEIRHSKRNKGLTVRFDVVAKSNLDIT